MCFTMIFRLKNFHSAGKVPCDGVASSIPPGKFFATASQAFCRLESSLRRRRRHSATRRETFFTLFDPQVTHFPSKTSLAGEFFSDLTYFAPFGCRYLGLKPRREEGIP